MFFNLYGTNLQNPSLYNVKKADELKKSIGFLYHAISY